MADETTPTKATVAIMRRLCDELERGTLVLVDVRFRDAGLVKFRVELAAPMGDPDDQPAKAPTRACPKCGEARKDKIREAGRPAPDSPTLDLLCVSCQHVWNVPEEA